MDIISYIYVLYISYSRSISNNIARRPRIFGPSNSPFFRPRPGRKNAVVQELASDEKMPRFWGDIVGYSHRNYIYIFGL